MTLLDQGREAVLHGRTTEAVDCFEQLVRGDPCEPAYHWNLSMALLSVGDYDRAFDEMSWRWHPSLNGNEHEKDLSARGIPKWTGETLEGKHIIVFHEWGFGDAIMMLRYLRLLREQKLAGAVTVILPKCLHGLVFNIGVRLVEHIPDVRWRFDYCCPMYDLPKHFGIQPNPYLRVLRPLQKRLHGHKIGIAWSGSKSLDRDKTRSIELDRFLELLEPRDSFLYALQKINLSEMWIAHEHGMKVSELNDFSDTAALINRMDRVVCVDTASAHLAGALGHPNAHVMLDYAHDWRWYRGDDWYPTLKRHRQPSLGDWAGAFEELKV